MDIITPNKALSFLFTTVLSFILILALSLDVNAQCKRYTKKNCLPSLSPYLHNGQLTSAYMAPGDSADVLMTFNAGKEYRILVCSQELIGKVQFKVLDKKRKILYSSDKEETNPLWDFKVANTQQFIIQLAVPKMKKDIQKTNLIGDGCVSLMVGFKE